MLLTQLSKLKDALTQAHTLPDAKAAIQAFAPELGIAYDADIVLIEVHAWADLER